MKRVIANSKRFNLESKISRFSKLLEDAINLYYQFDDTIQSEIDQIVGPDMIIDIEDCIKAMNIFVGERYYE